MTDPANARFAPFRAVSLFAICLIVLGALLELGLAGRPLF